MSDGARPPEAGRKVMIVDATLREGEQTPGVCLDPHIKLAVAELLSELGVDVIEAGHPVVTEEIREGVRRIAAGGLRPLVGAHARCLRSDVEAALECGVGFIGIFYCVSDERLRERSITLGAACRRIAEVVAFARAARPELVIRFTPEDAVRSPLANVIEAAAAAVAAGADIVSVADTTGCMVPGTADNMYDYTRRLRAALDRRGCRPAIAVHCHNDRGLALANALDAFRAGADIIDATVLGLGERAGIVDLATLMAVLAADFGLGERWNMHLLPELYRLVSRYARVPVPVHHPVTGRHAFTHCAGVHAHAAGRNPLHYQSLDPAIVGRRSQVALDHMSGAASVRAGLQRIGIELDEDGACRVLQRVKRVGQAGRTVDAQELSYIVRYVREEMEPGGAAAAGAAGRGRFRCGGGG